MALPGNITPPTGAWKLVKDLVADTVGPMAVLAAGAGAFVKASAGAALNAQQMQQALAASDGADRLKKQFETLLGSASAAKRQVEMLAKAASSGAFTFDSLAQASKNLQVMTNGALNTEQALNKIQDAAAATGAPVDTMAASVADLYSTLKQGQGVEGAADQLKQLGAISDGTAEKIKSLSQAGVGLSTTWQIVEADLKRASGAASELGGTISGLQQQLANIQQSSDTKIGEMFAEGEKAGLRAAIGFQKFSAAVAEANAGPWAAFNEAINTVKESIGGFLGKVAETGAVKGAFQALGVVAIAVLVGINAAIFGVLASIGKFIVATGALRVAMTALGSVMAGFAGFVSVATLGASAAAAAIIGIGVAALNAENNLRGLIEKLKVFTSESDKSASASAGASTNIRSPEEQKKQIDIIDQQLKMLEENKKEGQKTIEQGRENSSANPVFSPIKRFATGPAQVAAGEFLVKDADRRKKELLDLRAKVSQSSVGPDNARFEKEEAQRKQEKEISERARERIQASASPKVAKEMAQQQKEKADRELNEAQVSQKNAFKDEGRLNKASSDFSTGRDNIATARSDFFTAKQSNDEAIEKEVDRLAGGKGLRKRQTPEQIKQLREMATSNLMSDKTFANNQATVDAGLPTEVLSVEGFDQAAQEAKSKSGKLQAERAKRQALLEERESATAAADLAKRQGDSVGGADALRRLADVDLQARNLSDPETGQQLGASALDPEQMRSLDSQISQAKDSEDVGKKRAAKEVADIQVQMTSEAEAADSAANQAAERKLNAERQVAALGSSDRAAKAELEPEIKQLEEKLRAVKALEAAERAYQAAQMGGDSKEIAKASANLNERKIEAAGAGVQQGDTSDSVTQEKSGVEQILKIRQQQYAIEQAAAQARRNEIMQELRLMQQLAQLNLSNATGTTGGGEGVGGDIKEQEGKVAAAQAEVEAANKSGDQQKIGEAQAKLEAEQAKLGQMRADGGDIKEQEGKVAAARAKAAALGEASSAALDAEFGPRHVGHVKERDALSNQINASKEVAEAESALEAANKSGDQQKIGEAQANLNAKKNQAKKANDVASQYNVDDPAARVKELEGFIFTKQGANGAERGMTLKEAEAEAAKSAEASASANAKVEELMPGQIPEKDWSSLNNARKAAENEAKAEQAKLDKMQEGSSEVGARIQAVQEKKNLLTGGDSALWSDSAVRLSEERDVLAKKMEGGGGTEDDAKRMGELNEQLSAKGIGEKETAQDVKNKVTDLTNEELDLRTQQVGANRDIVRNAEIKSLSMQEKYAPNREAGEAAKARREELEDEAKVESKTAQYSETMESGKARELAEKETELERVGIRAEETGQARVDSLTAVGGGATGFIGADQDPAKKTADLTAQIKSILDSVTTKLDNQTSEAQRLAQEMREAAK
jgi:hypothetical protein